MKVIFTLAIMAVAAVIGVSSGSVNVPPVAVVNDIAKLGANDVQSLAATRSLRLNYGSISTGDRVLYSSIVHQDAVLRTAAQQEIMFYSSESVITAVQATELGTATTATAVIVEDEGEKASDRIRIRFTSALARAFQFQLVIFGHNA